MFSFGFKTLLLVNIVLCTENEETKMEVTDIVSYIDGFYPETIRLIAEILIVNTTIFEDVRRFDPLLSEMGQEELTEIQYLLFDIMNSGYLLPSKRKCILDFHQEAIDTQMFVDGQLQQECSLGEKYNDMLANIYEDLVAIQEAAKNMPSEFVSANLWCSSNLDEPNCYEDVQRQVLGITQKISLRFNQARKVIETVDKQFEKTIGYCHEKAVAQLDNLDSYVKSNIQKCINL